MQQWFSPVRTSAVPDAIILNTQSLVVSFRKSIRQLKHEHLRDELVDKEVHLLESIIQSLQFDNRVELELRCGSMDVVRCEFDIHNNEDLIIITEAVVELGYGIYCELQRLRAYQQGYLYYQYHGMDGYDIIMARFIPQPIHCGRSMRGGWNGI
jgi:hypothetical protein